MNPNTNSVKKYSWALKAFLSLTLIARLFQLMHWPFAKEFTITAAVIIVIFYPLRYLAKTKKEFLDHVKVFMFILYGIISLFGLEGNIYLRIAYLIPFGYWFMNEGFYYFSLKPTVQESSINDEVLDEKLSKKSNYPYEGIADLVIIVSIVFLFIGALFKIMHWPFASILLILSLSTLSQAIWFKDLD